MEETTLTTTGTEDVDWTVIPTAELGDTFNKAISAAKHK